MAKLFRVTAVAVMARHAKPGVWNSVEGMIETKRAIEAGRDVRFETRTVDASDKFVE